MTSAFKRDPANDPRSFQLDDLKSNRLRPSSTFLTAQAGARGPSTRSWRSISPGLRVRSAKTVYYCLNIQTLDEVANFSMDALRTSFSTVLDDTNENMIHLSFDQDDGFVVMALTLNQSVESAQD